MKAVSVALVFSTGLILSSCQKDKPIADGFVCVTPIPKAEMDSMKLLDVSAYQETASGSGRYIPKGWIPVPEGPYKLCYVPPDRHDTASTLGQSPK